MMLKAINVDEAPSENAIAGIFEGGTANTKTLIDKHVSAEETRVAIVTFSFGARTKMHVHNHEQIVYILSAKIRQVQFDQYGAVFIVNGKMEYRRIRLIKSAPLLAGWLDTHPSRNDPNAPLWVNVGSTRHGGAFDYNAPGKC
jgi:hypothetical protein